MIMGTHRYPRENSQGDRTAKMLFRNDVLVSTRKYSHRSPPGGICDAHYINIYRFETFDTTTEINRARICGDIRCEKDKDSPASLTIVENSH